MSEPQFGSVRINAPGSPQIAGHFCPIDRVAMDDGGVLKLISMIVSTQQAKAYRAVLGGGVGGKDVTLEVTTPDWDGHFVPDQTGYQGHVHRLAYGKAHVVFSSLDPCFMRVINDAELSSRLYPPSKLYTTPLLDDWLPYIRDRLQAAGLLKPCKGWGCECAILAAGNDELDRIVEIGLEQGSITIPETFHLVGST
jgi:hypothetical protein